MMAPSISCSGGESARRDSHVDVPRSTRDSGVAQAGQGARQYWCGVVQNTWWFYFTGYSTDELWHAYIDHCRAMLESGAEHPSFVCIAHRADAPSGDQRRLLGDYINSEAERSGCVLGFALVLDSPLHILALKAINWFTKKPFPETVCGSTSAAVTWLEERGAPVDLQTFNDAIDAVVPPEYRWSP